MEELNNIVTPSDWVDTNSIIKVIGVGGAGCNAVSYMYNQHIEGCSFIVCNTDRQVLEKSPVSDKIQLGEGLGAGTDPTKGRNCAIESMEVLRDRILNTGTQMLFVTAGMGGGTGTGAAPVVAKIAKDAGILTVAVVTLPFKDEKNGSYGKAIDGIRELETVVDSLLVIDNQKILETYPDLLLYQAFPKTDEVLATAVRSIIDIIQKNGHINVDFQDVRNMMKDSGFALMGSGVGSGENRLHDAVENAMSSPLLMAFDPHTAKQALINITIGLNEESIKAGDLPRINEEVGKYLGKANTFKRGIVYDSSPDFGDKVQVTIIATGIKMNLLDNAVDFNEGSVIFLDDDYCYEPFRAGEEVELPDTRTAGCLRGGKRKFWYVEKPALCVEPKDNIAALENETATKRKYENLEKGKNTWKEEQE